MNALRDIIDGIETLHADLSSHESPLSTLEALARRTTSATLLVSTTVPALRALRSTLPFLKPAAGAFVVSNSQTLELKHQLASCARALEGTLEKVAKMERVEEGDGKKESRMRLLKCIKAREGEGVESSELMAKLLGAERDGGRAVAEKLEVRGVGVNRGRILTVCSSTGRFVRLEVGRRAARMSSRTSH